MRLDSAAALRGVKRDGPWPSIGDDRVWGRRDRHRGELRPVACFSNPRSQHRVEELLRLFFIFGGAAGHVSRTVLYVLSEIKPEHIEEMTYHDCFDTSVPGPHGQAALIVTLKTGVRYDPGRGSYVVK